ncbi:transcription factor bHLH19-like [Neltuma alba]|uniref:transcription factor bHLH19-like n=1 Tax=Neltuma alba TaxID=207710 RepID=UPI0010A2D6E9|nr:transcription factor bHLH19-like [Prosopis alba]
MPLDKVTILDEAIKYMKQLQERVRELEKDPSLTAVKRIECCENDDDFYEVNEELPKIEVRVAENQMFMGIHCEKQKGIEFKILSLLENFHLSVSSSSVLPFGKSTRSITIIAQVAMCK